MTVERTCTSIVRRSSASTPPRTARADAWPRHPSSGSSARARFPTPTAWRSRSASPGARRRRDPGCRALPRALARLHEGPPLGARAPADGRGLVPDAGHRGRRDGPRRPGHLPRARAARGLSDLRPLARWTATSTHTSGRWSAAMIASLGDFGIPAQVFDGLTGVWTAGDAADRTRRDRAPANAGRRGRSAGWRGAEDRLDRHPRERRDHDARARREREQRPPAVRVDRPVRDRPRADDLGRPRARRARPDMDAFADVASRPTCRGARQRKPVERTLAELGAVAA